jgi:RNA-binding protein YlmH
MDQALKERIEELCLRAERKNIPLHTLFLDPAEQSLARGICRAAGAKYAFEGGYEEAERRMLFLLPDYLEDPPVEEALAALELKYAPQNRLTHRDILGALMAQQVKRSCIGDILVGEGVSYAFVFAGIAGALNLEKAGRANLSLRVIPAAEAVLPRQQAKEVRFNVPSTRLDCILAGLFSLPRSRAAEFIAAGAVSVNFFCVQDKGKEIHEGDVISLKGKGRAKMVGIDGVSKKGRLFILGEVSL